MRFEVREACATESEAESAVTPITDQQFIAWALGFFIGACGIALFATSRNRMFRLAGAGLFLLGALGAFPCLYLFVRNVFVEAWIQFL